MAHTLNITAVAFLISWLNGWFAGCRACDMQQVQNCIGPSDAIHNTPESDSIVFPYYDDATLDHICKSYRKKSSCLEAVPEKCKGNFERTLFAGTEDTLKYVCNDGYEDYKEHRACITSPNRRIIAMRCNLTYNNNMKSILQTQASLRERKRLLCRYMYEFAACMRLGVDQVCGSEAGDWVHHISLATLTPTLKEISCTRDINLTLPAIFGIILTILAVLLTIAGFLYVCQKKQKQGRWLLTRSQRQRNWARSSSLPSCATKSIVDCPPQSAAPLMPPETTTTGKQAAANNAETKTAVYVMDSGKHPPPGGEQQQQQEEEDDRDTEEGGRVCYSSGDVKLNGAAVKEPSPGREAATPPHTDI